MGVATPTTSNAEAASATANAAVQLVPASGISNTGDLGFASVVPAAGADTVVISTAGARTCGATPDCTGTVSAAAFSVIGGASLGYTITLPASATVTSGANSMTVDTFAESKTGSGTLDGTGNDSFNVDATLNVGASQPTGTYTGTFNVTIEYN